MGGGSESNEDTAEDSQADGACCFASADVLMCPGLIRRVDGAALYVPTDSMPSATDVPGTVSDCKVWLDDAPRCEKMATIARWLFSIVESRLGGAIASVAIPILMQKSLEN